MLTILLILQVIFGLGIIGLVLIQKTGTDGFGLGGGSGLGIMSGRAKANFFTRATAIFAAGFMLNSLIMAFISSRQSDHSLIDQIPLSVESSTEKPKADTAPVESAPADKAAPAPDQKTEPTVPVEGKAKESSPVTEKKTEEKPVVPAVPKAQ